MKILISPRHDEFGQHSFEVDAEVVGGEDGVFAAWKDEMGIIKFAVGDDGNWWQINHGYHENWLGPIIKCLERLNNNE